MKQKQSIEWKKFNMRITPEDHLYIKSTAAQMKMLMTEFVLTCIKDHKKSLEIIEEQKKIRRSPKHL